MEAGDAYVSKGAFDNHQKLAMVLKSDSTSLVTTLKNYDSDYKKGGRSFNDLANWMDIKTTALSSEARVLLVLPFDINQISLDEKEKNKVLIKVQIHNALFTGLNCLVTVQEKGKDEISSPEVSKFNNHVPFYVLSKVSNANIIATADIPSVSILPNDIITVSITHEKLGWIEKYSFHADEIMNLTTVGKPKRSILDSFKVFRGYQNLGGHLNSGNEPEHVLGINNLLSLFGFHSIMLRGSDEEIPGEHQQLGSADILSFYPEKDYCLIVDCTTGSKRLDDKINSIKNTVSIFRKKSSINALPVVITSQGASAHFKSLVRQDGVVLIDKADIDVIMTSIMSSNLEEANIKFFSILEPDTGNNDVQPLKEPIETFESLEYDY